MNLNVIEKVEVLKEMFSANELLDIYLKMISSEELKKLTDYIYQDYDLDYIEEN